MLLFGWSWVLPGLAVVGVAPDIAGAGAGAGVQRQPQRSDDLFFLRSHGHGISLLVQYVSIADARLIKSLQVGLHNYLLPSYRVAPEGSKQHFAAVK
jgi:hypothetical protein